jgi:hypothetical protein
MMGILQPILKLASQNELAGHAPRACTQTEGDHVKVNNQKKSTLTRPSASESADETPMALGTAVSIYQLGTFFHTGVLYSTSST